MIKIFQINASLCALVKSSTDTSQAAKQLSPEQVFLIHIYIYMQKRTHMRVCPPPIYAGITWGVLLFVGLFGQALLFGGGWVINTLRIDFRRHSHMSARYVKGTAKTAILLILT